VRPHACSERWLPPPSASQRQRPCAQPGTRHPADDPGLLGAIAAALTSHEDLHPAIARLAGLSADPAVLLLLARQAELAWQAVDPLGDLGRLARAAEQLLGLAAGDDRRAEALLGVALALQDGVWDAPLDATERLAQLLREAAGAELGPPPTPPTPAREG
jgi:hypothetical protein